MKRLVVLALSLFIFCTSAVSAFAADSTAPKQIVLKQNEVVNHNYFTAGRNIQVSGKVNGDAYVAGGNVIVDGTVTGDLLVAGGDVTVSGAIGQNLRVIGGNVTVSGRVGRDVSAAGGQVTIDSSSKIGRAMNIAGGTVKELGAVGNDVNLAAGDTTIGNSIGGNVNADVENGTIAVEPTTTVAGNFSYWSEMGITIPPQAKIHGKTIEHASLFKDAREKQQAAIEKFFHNIITIWRIGDIIASLIFGLLLLKLVPNYVEQVALPIQQKTGLSAGVGLVTIILVPTICVLLSISLIGIPVALIIFVLLLLLSFFSKLFVSFVVGRWVMSKYDAKNTSIYAAFIVGYLIYILLTLLPAIGGLISFIVLLIGLGAMLITKKTMYIDLREKRLI